MKERYTFRTLLLQIIMTFAVLMVLFPIALIVINSLKSNREIVTNILAIPTILHLENFIEAFQKMGYLQKLINTVVISICSVFGIVIFGSMVSYKITRVKGKVSSGIFYGILFTMVIPFQVMMVPIVIVARALHLVDSIPGIIFLYWGFLLPMAIFLYCGFIKGVPKDIEEAAMIDGCGQFRTFFKVVFPLLKPITTTVIIINILGVYNDFMLPMIFLSSSNHKTIQLSMSVFYGSYLNRWDLIMAALVMSILPGFIFFAVFQKQIIAGMTAGAVKG